MISMRQDLRTYILLEMIEVTSKDIDTTFKDVEQDTSFIKPDDRDKLLPL